MFYFTNSTWSSTSPTTLRTKSKCSAPVRFPTKNSRSEVKTQRKKKFLAKKPLRTVLWRLFNRLREPGTRSSAVSSGPTLKSRSGLRRNVGSCRCSTRVRNSLAAMLRFIRRSMEKWSSTEMDIPISPEHSSMHLPICKEWRDSRFWWWQSTEEWSRAWFHPPAKDTSHD